MNSKNNINLYYIIVLYYCNKKKRNKTIDILLKNM